MSELRNSEHDHQALYVPQGEQCKTCKYGARTDCGTMAFWKMPVRERGHCNGKKLFVVDCSWYVRKEVK